jgi:hypothetical protein
MKIPRIFMLKPFFHGEFKTRPRQKAVIKPYPVTAGYRSNIKNNCGLSILLLIYLFSHPNTVCCISYPSLTELLMGSIWHSVTLSFFDKRCFIGSWISHKPRFSRHIEVANVQISIRLDSSLVEYLLLNVDLNQPGAGKLP